MNTYKPTKASKRKFLEVEEDVAKQVQIFCFLRGMTLKKFVTQTMEKELQPYQQWLENIKKLKIE